MNYEAKQENNTSWFRGDLSLNTSDFCTIIPKIIMANMVST